MQLKHTDVVVGSEMQMGIMQLTALLNLETRQWVVVQCLECNVA